jgi:hypothetical protein
MCAATLVGALLLLGACEGGSLSPTAISSVSTAEIEAAIFQATNIVRRNQDLSALTIQEAMIMTSLAM